MGLAVTKQEAFWEACGFGHTRKVKYFIDQGINVDWVSYTHNSCAIHVASQGKPEIVKMLIDAKCNINVKDDRGSLALHHAAMKGHGDIMQRLIDAGSEIDTQDKNGWSPLFNAAYFCQPTAVEILIANNCDVNLLNKDLRTALHEACRSPSDDENGLAIIACHLVEAGADINLKSSDCGEADFTPLMFAAYHGHAEMADVIAEAGCDINAQGTNGWSALHWAADRGHCQLVQVLLHWDIDPLLEGRRGELAIDRTEDAEIKKHISEAMEKVRQEREVPRSYSPVSTTSPVSSRCSSVESLPQDNKDEETSQDRKDENSALTEKTDPETSDTMQGSHGEKSAEETNEKSLVDSHNAKDEGTECSEPVIDNNKENTNNQQDVTVMQETLLPGVCSSEEASVTCSEPFENSTTSGTVSEKDEKEYLEKDLQSPGDSPDRTLIGSQPEQPTPTENGDSQSEPLAENSSSSSTSNVSSSSSNSIHTVNEACDSPIAASSQPDESNADSATNNCAENITDTTKSKDLTKEVSTNDVGIPAKATLDSVDNTPAPSTDVSVENSPAHQAKKDTTQSAKLNPLVQRLVAPSRDSEDEGNLSDSMFNDADYRADLADSDEG